MLNVKGKAFLNIKGEAEVRTIDAARVVHLVYSKLKARSKTGKIFAKIDIEGAELRVLPYMLLQQALCLIDYATIEWHSHLFLTGFARESARRRGLAELDAGSEAVQLISNRTKAAIEEAVAMPSCKLQWVDIDDETYLHDGPPLPVMGSSVCAPAASTSGATVGEQKSPKKGRWSV